MDKDKFHALVEKSEPNICEISVMKDGQLIYEDFWQNYKAGEAVNIMSVTKSVVSLLIGIAFDKGFINSLDEPVLNFFPEYKVRRGEKTIYDVTLRHLLTMSAPFKYTSEPWTKVCTSSNWTYAALDLLGGRKGLTGEFKYSTLGIQILNGVLEKATGEKVLDFANKELFNHLDIPEVVNFYGNTKEEHLDFTTNKTPKIHEWYTDPTGCVTAGWGLALSARDLAKIGAMVAAGGSFNKQTIVSNQWIETISKVYQRPGKHFRNMGYGFLWWITNEKDNIFAAIGNCGNLIYVNPKENLAVGIGATFQPGIFDRVDFVENKLLPVILENEDITKDL